MSNSETVSGNVDNKTEITLGLLNAVDRDSTVTQRNVASELGIALGLANAYLKRCVKKGLIKVTQAPANRYAYYLTPRGFAEKSRLTAEYLSFSFTFFRRARVQCVDIFARCAGAGWTRVALAGTGELAEIATLSAAEMGIELAGILAPGERAKRFVGLPVVGSLDQLGQLDAVVLTDLQNPQSAYRALCQSLDASRILVPALLRIRTDGDVVDEESGESGS